MTVMEVNETARPFSSEGGGDVGVLFLHDLGGSPLALREWADVTAAAGYRVSLPRLPGHGTSWRELTVTSWQDWVGSVASSFDALRGSCGTVFVAGLGMGAALALRLAERRPGGVAGLLLVNPSVTGPWSFVAGLALARSLPVTVRGKPDDVARPGARDGGYGRLPVQAVYGMTRLWADVRPYLDLVTCPVLLFRSAIDHVVAPLSSDAVQRLTSTTDLTTVVLANSYHVAPLDFDKELVFATSLEWLAARS